MNRGQKIILVMCWFVICAAGAVIHHALQVERRSVQPAELYEAVWRQIHAFRAADFPLAYRQISLGFQERFTPDAFVDLVRTDYPDLLRAERIEFGNIQHAGQFAIIQVYFLMPDGDVVPCIYSLVNEDGGWKIDAARVQKRWPPGRRLGGMRT